MFDLPDLSLVSEIGLFVIMFCEVGHLAVFLHGTFVEWRVILNQWVFGKDKDLVVVLEYDVSVGELLELSVD